MSETLVNLRSEANISENGIKMVIRFEFPEDSPKFKEIIDIACCYNAEISYKNGEFSAEVHDEDAHDKLFDEYYQYLF